MTPPPADAADAGGDPIATLFARAQGQPFEGAAVEQQRAASLRTQAAEAGQPHWDARATWLELRWLMPAAQPPQALIDARRAATVLHDAGDAAMAWRCRAAAARALYDLCREREALDGLQALQHAPADPTTRVGALLVRVLCLGHLGLLDEAQALLEHQALPGALDSGEPFLVARAWRALGVVLLQSWIRRRQPGLWRGPQGAPALQGRPPTPEAMLDAFEAARAALPPHACMPFIDVGETVAMAMLRRAEAAEGAARMAALARTLQPIDPPGQGYAIHAQAVLTSMDGDDRSALVVLTRASEIAQRHGYGLLMRDCLRLSAQLHERAGELSEALAATKAAAALDVRGLLPPASPEPP